MDEEPKVSSGRSMENPKDFAYEQLKQEILRCRLCEEKFGFEPRPVFQGNVHSKIMQISQAPSRNVHRTGKPFDDASGRKLREWYRITDEVFYNPDYFYIVSVARCFPGKLPGGGDRQPPKSCAEKWLLREIELIENEMFLLVGKSAADFFFPKQDFTSLVFENHELNGKPAYVLPHPSPLNVKWFKDHPEFLSSRIGEVEKAIHGVMKI